MKWFTRSKYGFLGFHGKKLSMKKLEERQWVLDMFKRKGYIVDKNSMREGK